MHDDVGAAGAEPSGRGETGRHRSGQDVHVRDLHQQESSWLIHARDFQLSRGLPEHQSIP